jgi:branched-chain amino acid transport system ATP-binding protein
VRFKGEDDHRPARREAIAKRGMIRTFQIVQPFAGQTVRENIAVGRASEDPRRAEALAKAEDVARQGRSRRPSRDGCGRR